MAGSAVGRWDVNDPPTAVGGIQGSYFFTRTYYGDNVPLLNRETLLNLRGDYTPSDRHAISFF